MKSGWTRRRFVREVALAGGAVGFGLRGLAQVAGAANEVLVRTGLGSLRGGRAGWVRVFRGVPFAEPPVGELRFRSPVAKRPWTGVRDATHFAAAAVQQGERDVAQSEDCLYLNVWAPDGVSGGKAPVFVWVHGGGFTGGTAFAPIFDGAGFAQQGIVLVTVAYRLGVLGFLDVEPLLGAAYAGSANNALRDLLLALQWVKGNIEAFGGDPERVTIGGESAGAKLADVLMGVPSAKGLFRSVVSESGGAERIWPKNAAQTVAEGFGKVWRDGNAGRTISAMRTAPARELVAAQTQLMETWPQHFPLRCELDGVLLPVLPIETIAAGGAKGRRLLIGTNRDESALFLGAHPSHDATGADLGNMGPGAFADVYARYASVYPEMTDEQRRIRAVTAEEYWVPSLRVADAAAKAGAAVWMYELAFARSGGPYQGFAFHSEDLALVWDKPNREFASAAAEASLAAQMHAAWAAFVRGETPTAPGLPAWPAYNPKTRPTMMLDVPSSVVERPQDAELQMWAGRL